MLLIKNADIFSPEHLGKKDILICSGKIIFISSNITIPKNNFPETTTIDADGLTAIPGLIDLHVHINGAGGEGGFTNRTPEMELSKLTLNGITTCIGLLGTDGTGRSMGSLLAKSRALQEKGLTTYCWTGCYEVPTRTLTDTVRSDIILVDKIVGAGEIAISDHRSSCPSVESLIHIGSECRVGGLLSGKCGILHLHVGDGKLGLRPLFDVIDASDIPLENLLPTHVNRNKKVTDQSIEYAKSGGHIDITTGIKNEGDTAVSASDLYIKMLQEKISPYNITMSSDSGGSMPLFDSAGRLTQLTVGLPTTNMEAIHETFKKGIPLEDALIPMTSSPAKLLKLADKGHIRENFDADLLLIDNNFNISHVISKGKIMVKGHKPTVYDTFEPRNL
jgi:beta-aspartyl-dipeptidase (metallo-type)